MYEWSVFVHLLGLLVFAVAHGVNVFTAFRIRLDREPRTVASLLSGSQVAVGGTYVGLLLLGIGGLSAAWSGGLLTAPWVVASYVVIGIVLVVMWSVASPYYRRLRELAGNGTGAVDQAALSAALDSRRPEVLAAVGFVGLVVLTWLMVLKPG
jgi:uncharacterized membrane protein